MTRRNKKTPRPEGNSQGSVNPKLQAINTPLDVTASSVNNGINNDSNTSTSFNVGSNTDSGNKVDKPKYANRSNDSSTNNKRGKDNPSKTQGFKFGAFSPIEISKAPWVTEVSVHEVLLPDQTLLPSLYVRNICFTPHGSPGSDCYSDFFASTYPRLYQLVMSSTNMGRKLRPDDVWNYFSSVTFALGLSHVILKMEQILLNRNSDLAQSNFLYLISASTSQEIFGVAHSLANAVGGFRLPKALTDLTLQLFSPNLLSGTKFVSWFLPLSPNSFVIPPIAFRDRAKLLETLEQTVLDLQNPAYRDISSLFIRTNVYNPVPINRPDGNITTNPSLENIWINSGRLFYDNGLFHGYFKTSSDLSEEFVYHSVLLETSVDTLSMLHIDISNGEKTNYNFSDYDNNYPIEFDHTYNVVKSLSEFVSKVNVFYGRISFPSIYDVSVYSPRAVYTFRNMFIDEVILNQTFIWPSRVRDLFNNSIDHDGKSFFNGYRSPSDVRTFKVSLRTLKQYLFTLTRDLFQNIEPVNVNRTKDNVNEP